MEQFGDGDRHDQGNAEMFEELSRSLPIQVRWRLRREHQARGAKEDEEEISRSGSPIVFAAGGYRRAQLLGRLAQHTGQPGDQLLCLVAGVCLRFQKRH